MSDWLNVFYNLQVTETCNLRCLGCTLWNRDVSGDLEESLRNLIYNDTFFSIYPRRKIYNIIGGEPSNFRALPDVLSYLKNNSIKNYLWTNLTMDSENLMECLPFVNRLFVYLPFPSKESYENFTGEASYETILYNLQILKKRKIPVSFYCPVTPENISWLPDIYEFAYQNKAELILYWNPKRSTLSKESVQFLKRYKRVKNVWLIKTKPVPDTYCPGLPYGPMSDSLAYLGDAVHQLFLKYGGIFV